LCLKLENWFIILSKFRTIMNLFQMMFEHNRNFMKYDLKTRVMILKVEQKEYELQISNSNNEAY